MRSTFRAVSTRYWPSRRERDRWVVMVRWQSAPPDDRIATFDADDVR